MLVVWRIKQTANSITIHVRGQDEPENSQWGESALIFQFFFSLMEYIHAWTTRERYKINLKCPMSKDMPDDRGCNKIWNIKKPNKEKFNIISLWRGKSKRKNSMLLTEKEARSSRDQERAMNSRATEEVQVVIIAIHDQSQHWRRTRWWWRPARFCRFCFSFTLHSYTRRSPHQVFVSFHFTLGENSAMDCSKSPPIWVLSSPIYTHHGRQKKLFRASESNVNSLMMMKYFFRCSTFFLWAKTERHKVRRLLFMPGETFQLEREKTV